MKRLRALLGLREAAQESLRPWEMFRECEQSLNLIQDLDLIAQNFLGRIGEILKIDRMLLVLSDSDRGELRPIHSIGLPEDLVRGMSIAPDGTLVKWLKVNETYLDLRENPGVRSYLQERERSLLDGIECDLLFPVMAMNRLIGIILCCGRSQQPSRRGDIALVVSLTPQIGMALENAFLYREQRDRFRRMSRADRLATVGELAAGAAHEIRNPLTAVKSSLQYLASRQRDDVEKKLLATALAETERIEKILSGLLSFSRQPEGVMEVLDVRSVLDQSIELIGYQARESGVVLEPHHAAARLMVSANREQLKQLFLNLLVNSIQAMAEGGRVRIETSAIADHAALIVLTDTGCGIPSESIDRIFDPFFTLKKGGTGLGLSIAYGIVKRHRGDIEVRSTEGIGTTMLVRLPLVAMTEAEVEARV